MDKPISVGDWVVVVRACCDKTANESLGLMGPVQAIRPLVDSHCIHCGTTLKSDKARFTDGLFPAAPLTWLKRIPPIEELEGEKRDEEITA